MNESVCIYLRKSRADREAEAHGEGETLARHERILLDIAKKKSTLWAQFTAKWYPEKLLPTVLSCSNSFTK